MDDLKTTLIDVYEFLLYQQKLLTQAAVRVQALTTVMMHFEQLAELYPKVLAEVETGKIAQQGTLNVAAIEQKLLALRGEGEAPFPVQ